MPKVRFKPTLPYNSGADGGSVNHFDKPPLLPYLLTSVLSQMPLYLHLSQQHPALLKNYFHHCPIVTHL